MGGHKQHPGRAELASASNSHQDKQTGAAPRHRCPNTGEMGRALASQIRRNYLRLKAHSAGLQLIGFLSRSLHVANAERILKKLSYLMQT